jgi:hypothetical protein
MRLAWLAAGWFLGGGPGRQLNIKQLKDNA